MCSCKFIMYSIVQLVTCCAYDSVFVFNIAGYKLASASESQSCVDPVPNGEWWQFILCIRRSRCYVQGTLEKCTEYTFPLLSLPCKWQAMQAPCKWHVKAFQLDATVAVRFMYNLWLWACAKHEYDDSNMANMTHWSSFHCSEPSIKTNLSNFFALLIMRNEKIRSGIWIIFYSCLLKHKFPFCRLSISSCAWNNDTRLF